MLETCSQSELNLLPKELVWVFYILSFLEELFLEIHSNGPLDLVRGFFFLELIFWFCSVNKPYGIAVSSPGTRWPPISHLKKFDIFCETVSLATFRIQIQHLAEPCEHFEMCFTFLLGHLYLMCCNCPGAEGLGAVLAAEGWRSVMLVLPV